MSRNIKLTLRYDGCAFHGWQYQPNCVPVEGELKKACERILGEQVKLHSCSRTDAGVHANMFCCNFHTESDRKNEKLMTGLNAVLPTGAAVYGCEDVPDGFHARYDCKGKEYVYKIWNSPQRNPFYVGHALHYPAGLDVDFLNTQARQFIGRHDFTSFCASGSSVKTTVRTIFDCRVEREGEMVYFGVHGDGFLYNMVRIMVGTLLDISGGKIEPDSIERIINAGNRQLAGVTAQPQGLYLNKVFY